MKKWREWQHYQQAPKAKEQEGPEKTWQELRDDSVRAKTGPLTEGQKVYWSALRNKSVILATGPAGTGKTYAPCVLGADWLAEGKFNKIVLSRPMVSCGAAFGWLPGDDKAKLLPYVRPMLDVLQERLGRAAVDKLFTEERLELVALELMRGASYKNTLIVLDEAQNAELAQLRMLLTRLGKGSKVVIAGDISQSDLPTCPMLALLEMFHNPHPDVGIVCLTAKDIVRHGLLRWVETRFAGQREEWLDFDCPACGAACWFAEYDMESPVINHVRCWSCKSPIRLAPDLDGPHRVEESELAEPTFPREP